MELTDLWTGILEAFIISLNTELRCDLHSISIVVWLCAGVERLFNYIQRQQKGPETPGVEGQHRANKAINQEGRARYVFWHFGPSVMETVHGKVSSLSYYLCIPLRRVVIIKTQAND